MAVTREAEHSVGKFNNGVACVALIAGGALIPATATAAPATAARHHCATHSQYRKVHKGQTIAKVARELGHRGHVEAKATSDGFRTEIRSYKACGEFNVIDVSFSANPHRALREDAKSGVFVS
jgi:hypothetical protein